MVYGDDDDDDTILSDKVRQQLPLQQTADYENNVFFKHNCSLIQHDPSLQMSNFKLIFLSNGEK